MELVRAVAATEKVELALAVEEGIPEVYEEKSEAILVCESDLIIQTY